MSDVTQLIRDGRELAAFNVRSLTFGFGHTERMQACITALLDALEAAQTENERLRRVADAARVAVDDWYFDGSYKDLRRALAALSASTEGESDASDD